MSEGIGWARPERAWQTVADPLRIPAPFQGVPPEPAYLAPARFPFRRGQRMSQSDLDVAGPTRAGLVADDLAVDGDLVAR